MTARLNTGRKSWRCFYCDDVFYSLANAAEHFGSVRGAVPACQIRGSDHNLIRIIRAQEIALERYRNEDAETLRAIETLRSEQAEMVRRAEDDGFARGVREMQKLCVGQFGKEVVL